MKPKWIEVTEAASQLTKRFLDFAVEYSEAYRDIKNKLSDDDVKRFNVEVGLNDAAASRLRQIAEANPLLRGHVKQLPPSFEALHAVAVFATDKTDKFDTAIKTGKIHPELTVRDARLLQPARRGAKKKSKQVEDESLRVELFFDSRESLVNTIASVLSESIQARVKNPHIRDAIKAKLGKTRYESVQAYLRR